MLARIRSLHDRKNGIETDSDGDGDPYCCDSAELRSINRSLREHFIERDDLRQQKSRLLEARQVLRSVTSHSSQQRQNDLGPILVVTFKNHALDEMLVDCKKFMNLEGAQGQLIRLGRRSQCKELEPHNLRAVMRMRSDVQQWRRFQDDLTLIAKQLQEVAGSLAKLQEKGLTGTVLERFLSETQKQQLPPGGLIQLNIKNWLKEDVLVHDPMGEEFMKLVQKRRPGASRAGVGDLVQAMDVGDDEEDDKGEDSDDDHTNFNVMRTDQGGQMIGNDAGERVLEDALPWVRLRRGSGASNSGRGSADAAERVAGIVQELSAYDDIFHVPRHMRQPLAKRMVALAHEEAMGQLSELLEKYLQQQQQFEEYLNQAKMDALQSATIIGMTTTGCAMHQELIRAINPSVLLVEEAAEILESQVVACLADSLQQVILIGDHKQLQPSCEVPAFARDHRLNVSLFERLLSLGHPVVMLQHQRRMAPEISALVQPVYAGQLQNHRSVHCRPRLSTGVGPSVFFWTHAAPERPSAVGRSIMNPMEVWLAAELVLYLVGFAELAPEQIVVLTPYKGQMQALRAAFQGVPALRDITIHTVDRFQGDEADVVVLSLARTMRRTSFLLRENRMVVALSRARHALFMLGSAGLLDHEHCAHWRQTLQLLAGHGPEGSPRVGSALPLVCPRHSASRGEVKMPRDVGRGVGGLIKEFCREPCRQPYRNCTSEHSADHLCPRTCHGGGHEECTHPCDLRLGCGHVCEQICGCECRCTTKVNVRLDCGHDQSVRCGEPPGPCEAPVVLQRARCQHVVVAACHTRHVAPWRPCPECDDERRQRIAESLERSLEQARQQSAEQKPPVVYDVARDTPEWHQQEQLLLKTAVRHNIVLHSVQKVNNKLLEVQFWERCKQLRHWDVPVTLYWAADSLADMRAVLQHGFRIRQHGVAFCSSERWPADTKKLGLYEQLDPEWMPPAATDGSCWVLVCLVGIGKQSLSAGHLDPEADSYVNVETGRYDILCAQQVLPQALVELRMTDRSIGTQRPRNWIGDRREVDVTAELGDLIRGIMQRSSHPDCRGGSRVSTLQVKHVAQLQNSALWSPYYYRRIAIRELHAQYHSTIEPLQPHVEPQTSLSPELDAGLNELFLFHGTSAENAKRIKEFGFDERVAKLNGLYGSGIYFAHQACKSLQYCDRDSDGLSYFFVCRVTLGAVHYTEQRLVSWRRPPVMPGTGGLLFDSVVANSGVANDGRQFHREYIVYDRTQVYPEYLVTVKMSV